MQSLTFPSLSENHPVCPVCGNTMLLPHDLGYVCSECGTVEEEICFDNSLPYIEGQSGRNQTYYAPGDSKTTLGKTSERNYHYDRLASLHRHSMDTLQDEARHEFRALIAEFEMPVPLQELLQIFRKAFYSLAKYSRSRNTRVLSFALYIQAIKGRGCITWPAACERWGISIHRLYAVLRDLSKIGKNQTEMPEITVARYWSRAQTAFQLNGDDLTYMQKMYNTRQFVGHCPQNQAAKIFILYQKAHQLEKFFQRLSKYPIHDWVDLLAAANRPNWCRRITKGLPELDMQTVAHVFDISVSQAYNFHLTGTWVRGRVIPVDADENLKIGPLRIPDLFFDKYFMTLRNQPQSIQNSTETHLQTVIAKNSQSKLLSNPVGTKSNCRNNLSKHRQRLTYLGFSFISPLLSQKLSNSSPTICRRGEDFLALNRFAQSGIAPVSHRLTALSGPGPPE